MSERQPKPAAGDDAARGTEPALRARSEWSKRLDLFGLEGCDASDAESTPDTEWERIGAGARGDLPRIAQPATASAAPSDASHEAGREALELALAAARREISDRDAENVGLRGALGAAHQQLRAREAEITDLTTHLAVAQATTSARQDELASLGGRYSGIEEKRNALEREVQRLREKLARAAEEAEKREIKIENLRATRATLEETIEARDRIVKARDEELGACEQELQAHRDRIASQYKSMADRDAELALLNDQLLAEQERARALEAEVRARDAMLDHQREKLAQRDEQLAALLATFDVVERTLQTRPGVSDLPQESGRAGAARPAAPGARSATPEPALPPSAVTALDAPPAEAAPAPDRLGEALDAPRPEALESSDPPDEEPLEEDFEPSCDAAEGDEAPAQADASDPDVAQEHIDEDADVAGDAVAADPPEPAAAAAAEPAIDGQAFAQERDVLVASGDLFAQRPPARPDIFGWWRDQRIAQSLAPLEVASFDALLAKTVARECAARPEETISIFSLSGADPEFELRLARELVARGHHNFAIDCFDDRESWHDARADLAEAEGLLDQVDTLPAASAHLRDDQQYDVFVADGTLAYVADLEALLAWIRNAWKENSVMVLGAVLGSGAAGDSPDNVDTIDRIWNVMPDRYMLNHVTGAEQTNYTAARPASDAPGSGGPLSPGVRPLLPLLLDEFCFEVFAPFGNLINAFVGPEIGPNFDPAEESDRSFIERFAKLDEGQIDAGTIHPVHLVAVLRSNAGGEAFLLENRAPERCLLLGE